MVHEFRGKMGSNLWVCIGGRLMMRLACLTAVIIVWAAASASAAEFPVTNSGDAIRVAKNVCRGRADPRLRWQAQLDSTRKTWIADTEPSLHKSGDPLWSVDIPVAGPRPSTCYDSLYDLVAPNK